MDAVSRIGGSRGLIGVRMRTRNLIRGHAAKKCGADHLRRRYVAKVRVHGVRRAPSTAADPTVTFSTAPDLVDYSSFSFKQSKVSKVPAQTPHRGRPDCPRGKAPPSYILRKWAAQGPAGRSLPPGQSKGSAGIATNWQMAAARGLSTRLHRDWVGTGTRNWDVAGTKPESDSWFLIPAGIPEFGYFGY
jgi:hypothetical protein